MDEHIPRISIEPDPYIWTNTDIQKLMEWASENNWWYYKKTGKWVQTDEMREITFEELIKEWEKSENG